MPGLGAFALAGAVGGAGQALLDRAKQQREDALRALQQQREDELYARRRGDELQDYQTRRQDMLADEQRGIDRENERTATTRARLGAIYDSGDPFFSLLSSHEGVGDPSTLYGHSQRDGGRFAGVDVSQMTIGEALEFADPSGEYGQWVAQNNNGTVATPMGKAQIVGTTLRRAAEEMGLPMDTVFDEATQRDIAIYLAEKRLASAGSQSAKRAALRSEWVGLKNASDAQVDAAIEWIEGRDSRSASLDLLADPNTPSSVRTDINRRMGLDQSGSDVSLTNGEINQIQDFYKDDIESGTFGLRQPTQSEMVAEVERLRRQTPNMSLADAYTVARNAWKTEDVTTETEVPRAALSPMRLLGDDTRTETSVDVRGGFDYGTEEPARVPTRNQPTPRMPSEPDLPPGVTPEQLLEDARDAIARGAPRDAVVRRLEQFGIDAGQL